MIIDPLVNSFHVAAPATAEEAGLLILQNTQDSYVLLNSQLRVVYFNRAAREGVQMFLNQSIFRGMQIMDLVPEERKEVLMALYSSVLLDEKQHVTEFSFATANGSTVFFENTFQPAYTNEGCICGVIVYSKNITEKKRAQQIIQESEARLQLALDAGNHGAWDWNLQTNEVIFSSSYKRLYGFSEGELKNHVSEWMTRIHPDDQAKMKDAVREHLRSDKPVLDTQYRLRAKDGNYRWVAAKGLLLYNPESGDPERMIGTHTDITESLERETRLKEMNERFDCVMKATNELLWEWDIINNKISRSAEGLRKVYGVKDNRTIEKIEDWLQRVHPDDRAAVRKVLDSMLLASHQQTFEAEYRFRRDDGEYAYIYNRGILLKDEEGRPARLIGSAQDISERKRLEKELLENSLEYQRMLHEATVDSQEKERAEIGKELHDNINQVLTTTKLYLDLALSNNEMKEELLRKSLKNVSEVIQDIRLLSRSLMDPSINDLGLLDSINDLVESIHLTQQLAVQVTAESSIEANLHSHQKLALFRIIQESLNNIVRHAKASEAFITITATAGHLVVGIRDNGIGFLPEKVKKGVGLKNIQNRIYLINGTLQITSKPGEGCKLEMQFPIKDNQPKI